MPSRAVTVTTTATRLDTTDDTADHIVGQSLVFYNNGSVTVYLGGSDVTTSNGFPIAAGSSSPGLNDTAEAWYGITASSSADVRVLEGGL